MIAMSPPKTRSIRTARDVTKRFGTRAKEQDPRSAGNATSRKLLEHNIPRFLSWGAIPHRAASIFPVREKAGEEMNTMLLEFSMFPWTKERVSRPGWPGA